MAKALKVVGVVLAVAALTVVTAGAATGLGVSLATTLFVGSAYVSAGALLLGAAVLSTAGSLLSPKPKAPSTSSASSDRLQVSVSLRTPRLLWLGSTAGGTDLRDQEWSSDQRFLHRFLVCASHKAHAIREVWFDAELVWSLAGGVQGKYVGWLDVTPVLEGSAANAINIGPRMGSSRRYTGCAYVYLRYTLKDTGKKPAESPFASAVPTRVTIVGDGIDVYDPRLDSTVPGGSGSHRANDQSTWSWTDGQARNPALAMLVYLLGWRINGKLAVGKGIPAARIDLASFITAANLCDEQVTRGDGSSEPRYRCDGVFGEGDEPGMVLDNLKATMNALLDDVDGKIRVTVLHNDLAVPIGALLSGDVLGDFTWAQTVPLTDSINVIRGGYTDPSATSLYQLVDYPEVAVPSPDGIDRGQTINLPLVQSSTQAQRLVRQRLQRAQYGGTFTAVFQATAWRFQKGDVIRLTFYPLGFDGKLFRIADMAIQVDGTVPMMLREEHAAIYAAYDDPAAAVTGVAPTLYDPSLWPLIQGLEEVDQRVLAIGDDSVLAAGTEKQETVTRKAALDADQAALIARYEDLGSPADISPARNLAVTKTMSLSAYLSGLSPAWTDVTTNTPIDRAVWNMRWREAYTAVAQLRAAITGRKGDTGQDGASAFTLANIYNMSAGSTTITKNTGSDLGWDAKGYTVEGYPEAALTAVLPAGTMIGLTTDPGNGPSYETIDYAIHRSADGNIYAFENGAGTNLGPVTGNHRYGVQANGRAVQWLVDGVVRLSRQPNTPDEVLYGSFAIERLGATIGSISFTVAGRAGADGATAPLVLTQWSIDGAANWHEHYFGADRYYRQSNDGGVTWGPAILGVGEAGSVGTDGTSPSVVFVRSATVPATPTDNSGNPPAGWFDGPPAGTAFLWLSKAVFRGATQLTSWSAPQRISGNDGAPGDPGPPGATADDLGLGVRTSGIAGVGLGSSGATVVAVNDPISLQAGRQLRLTLGCMNVTKDSGSSIVTANIVARLEYGGTISQLFQGVVSIGADGTMTQDALSAAAANLLSNPANGSATLVITYARGGPAGNYGSFDLAYSLERV